MFSCLYIFFNVPWFHGQKRLFIKFSSTLKIPTGKNITYSKKYIYQHICRFRITRNLFQSKIMSQRGKCLLSQNMKFYALLHSA